MEKTVGAILRAYLPEFLEQYKLSAHQSKVVGAVQKCRTAGLGYQLYQCPACGHLEMVYNGCRDRHCPGCQWEKQQAWVAERLAELPRVGYHHVVMTLPSQLHPLARMNPQLLYQITFAAGAETLQQFGRDPRHLGAEIGLLGVLHTWGQRLNYHVHLHFLVTAGGLNAQGAWVAGKSGEQFLFPVRAVSQVFRGKFIAKLRRAYRKGQWQLTGPLRWLQETARFEWYVQKLAGQMFRVHSQSATENPARVVKYLGAYMNRGPIGNGRIVAVADGAVTFWYRDHRAHGERKLCHMPAVEFIRRWVQHILPSGFRRVRYYGLFGGNQRQTQLAQLRALRGKLDEVDLPSSAPRCPHCQRGVLVKLSLVLEPAVISEREPELVDTS